MRGKGKTAVFLVAALAAGAIAPGNLAWAAKGAGLCPGAVLETLLPAKAAWGQVLMEAEYPGAELSLIHI